MVIHNVSMSGSVSPFEAGWSITKESDDKPDRFDFNAEYDPTGLVPEGYAEKHPNEYYEEAHGKGFHPSDWEEMSEEEREAYDERYFSNPMPYPRPLGLLPHSEINRYRDLLDEFRTQFSRFEHNPNLSEDERMELAVSLFDPANEAANLSEDFAQALFDEIANRSFEQAVDANRRGNLHAGGWKKDGTPFKPRGDSTHLPFTQQFQDIHTGEPMTIRSLLLKALGDPDEMLHWSRRFGGKAPYSKNDRSVFNWVASNKDKLNQYLDENRVDWITDEPQPIAPLSDLTDLTGKKQKLLAEDLIGGGFSFTSKMPGGSLAFPVHTCDVGMRLAGIKTAGCHACYATKGRYPLNSKQIQMYDNLHALTRNDPRYASALSDRIKAQMMFEGEPYWRWMDSGDLQRGKGETKRNFGAKHFAQLIDIARNLPQGKFWLPTRQMGGVKQVMDERGIDALPDNLKTRLSVPFIGQASDNEVNRIFGLPNVTSLLDELKEMRNIDVSEISSIDPSSKICPASALGGSCDDYDCRDCWEHEGPISYNLHEGSAKNRPIDLLQTKPGMPAMELDYGEDYRPFARLVDDGLDIRQFMRKT
jgi:hypothetical protein